MSAAWNSLGKSELQRYIGSQMLDRLELLLPALSPGFDCDQIFTRSSLAKIFESFSAHELIKGAEFRRKLFNSFPPDVLGDLYLSVFGEKNGEFREQVEELVKAGWSDNEVTKKIAQFLGLPNDIVPRRREVAPEQTRLVPSEAPYKPLKDYQSGVFFESVRKLEAPRSRFVLQMPTGSGKTRTAMEIVSTRLNESSEGSVVVWLAHSEELCEQAYECFKDVWTHVGKYSLRLVRGWGGGAFNLDLGSDRVMLIGGFQKLHSILRAKDKWFSALRERVSLVVVDEAHKVLAPTYKQVTQALCGEDAALVGLTATPGRGVQLEEENEALAEFFFNEIITIGSGSESPIEFLRRRGVLSNIKYEPVQSEREYKLSDKDKRHLERFFDLPKGVLKSIANDDIRNVEIVKRLEREAESGRQILFFACSVEHSRFISALLSFLGIRSAHVDGMVPPDRRSTLINDFKSGAVQVLCNYGVLSTGFDAPKVDVVFISRPTGSVVLYSQMIGRGLRGPAIGGTAKCKIIDVIDNIQGFSNQEAVFGYFDDYYR